MVAYSESGHSAAMVTRSLQTQDTEACKENTPNAGDIPDLTPTADDDPDNSKAETESILAKVCSTTEKSGPVIWKH